MNAAIAIPNVSPCRELDACIESAIKKIVVSMIALCRMLFFRATTSSLE